MANDFMRNANKVSLDGEVVSFSNTFPIVDIKEDVVVETPIIEEPKKEEKVEEIVIDVKDEDVVVETEDEKITESTEETTDEEKADEE